MDSRTAKIKRLQCELEAEIFRLLCARNGLKEIQKSAAKTCGNQTHVSGEWLVNLCSERLESSK